MLPSELVVRLKAIKYDIESLLLGLEALPPEVVDAIASHPGTTAQREDWRAYATASLRAGGDPTAVADAINSGLVTDDGE